MLITPIPVVQALMYAEKHPHLFSVSPHPSEGVQGAQTGWYVHFKNGDDEWAAIIARDHDEWVAFVKDEEGDGIYSIQDFMEHWLEGSS